MRCGHFDEQLGARLFFKCENLQKVGAFKARGATNAVLHLDGEVASRGVVTHSSGNHGAALAYAASRRGIPCTVVMPHDAPPIKILAVRGYGAEIVFCDRQEREAVCDRVRSESGMTLIHPFEHPDVIAGQGTAALELLEQAGPLDMLIAPVGGGGLLSGTTIAVTATSPATEVRGAEPLAADDACRSMQTGDRQPGVSDPESWADGLLTRLGQHAFDILLGARVRIVTVDEAQIVQAAWDISQRMKQVVEPSGATVLAALRRIADEVRGKRVGAIFSGGNTDFAWLDDPALDKR
jgi:threonine dehydratase